MGLWDSIESAGRKLVKKIKKFFDVTSLNNRVSKFNSYKNNIYLCLQESANIQIPYEHIRLIGELKEYDAEYGDKTVFKTAIGDFEELKKKIDNHNKTVALILENAKDFEESHRV